MQDIFLLCQTISYLFSFILMTRRHWRGWWSFGPSWNVDIQLSLSGLRVGEIIWFFVQYLLLSIFGLWKSSSSRLVPDTLMLTRTAAKSCANRCKLQTTHFSKAECNRSTWAAVCIIMQFAELYENCTAHHYAPHYATLPDALLLTRQKVVMHHL